MSYLQSNKSSTFIPEKKSAPIKLKDYIHKRQSNRQNLGIIKLSEMKSLTEVSEQNNCVYQKRRSLTKSIQDLIVFLNQIKIEIQNKFFEELVQQEKNMERIFQELFSVRQYGTPKISKINLVEKPIVSKTSTYNFSKLSQQKSLQTTNNSNSVLQKSSYLVIKNLEIQSKIKQKPSQSNKTILLNGSYSNILPTGCLSNREKTTSNLSSDIQGKQKNQKDKRQIKVKFR